MLAFAATAQGVGFFWAVEIGLLSGRILAVVELCVSTVDSIPALREQAITESSMRSLELYTTSLHRLCSESTALPDTGAPTQTDANIPLAQLLLTQAVIISFQILVVSCHQTQIVRFAAPRLARRLRQCLAKYHGCLTTEEKHNTQRLRLQLELWILVTGMFAASQEFYDAVWFQSEATNIVTALNVDNEMQLGSVLAPFMIAEDGIGAALRTKARSLLMSNSRVSEEGRFRCDTHASRIAQWKQY